MRRRRPPRAAACLKPLIAHARAVINGKADAAEHAAFQAVVDDETGSSLSDIRTYPERPYLAVSAAILRDGKVLVVRRARKPALHIYTLPGGAVQSGETLAEAVKREVREETQLDIEPVALAGEREVIVRDAQGRVERHFVILCFAARWLSGEPKLNEELDDARWLAPAELTGLKTTEGLAEIVAAAIERLAR
jgi:8-oxo-dGTP diphosphatase